MEKLIKEENQKIVKAEKKMAKRKVRKAQIETEIAARRQNKILQLLEAGKSKEQIIKRLGLRRNTFGLYVGSLRVGFRGEPPLFIPAKYKVKWKPGRAANLIEYATKVIEGKKRIKTKPELPYPRGRPVPLEKKRMITARLIKKPLRADQGIAKEIGVSYGVVAKIRKTLVESGTIRDVSVVERLKQGERKPERKTSFLNKEKRKQILENEKVVEKIQRKAAYLYYSNRNAFDFANMLPETIAEELAERLDWKLQTYDPSRMRGLKKTKLERYINVKLAQLAYDLKRTAWRQYRKIASLEFGTEEQRDIKRTLEAPLFSKDFIITVGQLAQISKYLKLNLSEKAVLFGIAAGVTGKKIGETLGYSGGRVSQIKTKIEKRVEKLLSK